MRVPLPTSKIVSLTLLGAVLVGVVSLGLAVPDLLPGGPDGEQTAPAGTTFAQDPPTPNEDFTPAVQQNAGHDDDEWYEHEEDEHEEEYGEDEHEDEHEEDDD